MVAVTIGTVPFIGYGAREDGKRVVVGVGEVVRLEVAKLDAVEAALSARPLIDLQFEIAGPDGMPLLLNAPTIPFWI